MDLTHKLHLEFGSTISLTIIAVSLIFIKQEGIIKNSISCAPMGASKYNHQSPIMNRVTLSCMLEISIS